MANGAYRTSELPQTTSMANTDRVVILYNAAGNSSVGNGSPGTRTIPLSKLIDSGMSEIFVDIAASNSLAIGNASSNLFVNSSSIYISNFEGVTFSVNTAGIIAGNGSSITSVQANNVNGLATVATSGSYTDLNNIPSFAVSAFLDTSNASNINTGTLGVGVTLPPPSYNALTVGNSSVNVVLNSTSVSVGTVNATANAIEITNSSIHVGNDSVYTVITANAVQIGNGTVYMNSSVISIGNSTVNVAYINSTAISVGNSSVNTTLSAGGQVVGNLESAAGGVNIANAYIYVGNSTINTFMNAYAFYAGNVSYYSTLTPISLYTSGPTSQSSIQPASHQVTNGSIFVGIINSTANAVVLSSNSSSFGIVVGNATVNATINSTTFSGTSLSSNNATNLGGTAASGYQTTAGLATNVATLTANDVTNVGGVPSSNIVSNVQLSSNLTSYTSTNFAVVNTAGGGTYSLPGGWHIAFGLVQTNTQGGFAITFANAFTSNAYSITTQVLLSGAANAFVLAPADRSHINTVTKSGFTLWTGNSTVNASANVYYMAIGY